MSLKVFHRIHVKSVQECWRHNYAPHESYLLFLFAFVLRFVVGPFIRKLRGYSASAGQIRDCLGDNKVTSPNMGDEIYQTTFNWDNNNQHKTKQDKPMIICYKWY